MSRGQFIPPVLIWGGGGGDGGNKCPWEGPAYLQLDHTGSPGNFLGLVFVHGKNLSNAVLPMFLIWLKQGSTGNYMKETVTLLFSGWSPKP